jgi:predicted nucleotidyltransferase
MLNNDYKDILQSLSAEKAKFLLVGAYALAAHGYPRATMDIDFWVKPDADNAKVVLQALERFGAPMENISPADLQTANMVFQIGVAPRRIDIITSVDGLTFDEAYARSKSLEIEGIAVQVLSVEDLIINKRSTGRTKDIADAEMLEER